MTDNLRTGLRIVKRVARNVRNGQTGQRGPQSGEAPAQGSTDTQPAADTEDETPQNTDTVRTLSSLDELDKKLEEVGEAWKISDDAMRAVFAQFQMTYPKDMPSDPYSTEYSDRVFEYYRVISGRESYEVKNEELTFSVDAKMPFPYYTHSPDTVGHQMIAIGFIILSMKLSAGASVLELGAGWGNTTIALAHMGYDVTAVDINESFSDLIRDRADNLGLNVRSLCGGFLDVDQLGLTFDAVLFYEAFHHCSDHRELISKLESILNPGGKVFFAAEPIHDIFPAPWGLRLDGESLWAIRQNGWLELGFQESYFLRTLQRFGWVATRHTSPISHLADVIAASRANGVYTMGTFKLPSDEDVTWAPADLPGVEIRFSSRASRISIEVGGSFQSIVLSVGNFAPHDLEYFVECGSNKVTGTASPHTNFEIEIPYDPEAAGLVIGADTWRPSEALGTGDQREIGLAVKTITLR
jgi:SAM-dependent methyltransferase